MTTPRAIARLILLLALAMGVLVDVLWPGNAAGLNAVLVMIALLVGAAVVAGPEGIARFDPADAWLPVGAVVFAAMPAIRADDWLVVADLLLAVALGAGTIACLAGARITRGLVPSVLATSVGVLTAVVVGAASVISALRRRAGAEMVNVAAAGGPAAAMAAVDGPPPAPGSPAPDTATPRPGLEDRIRPALPVVRGLLLALPVLALFALLFASADAVFAEMARSALDWRVDVDLADLAQRALVITTVAWGVAGLLALAAGLLPDIIPGRPKPTYDAALPAGWAHPGGRSLGAASASELSVGPRLGTVEASVVLGLVAVLFAGFVVLQLAYLFGGRDTLAIAGMTYSDYARRGFFELVAVAVLAGMLVIALDLAVGRRSSAQLVASLVLLGLTAAVLVSAFVRLRLYQDAYGWTELRFVVVVAIGWLAVALAAAAWMVLTRTTQWTLHVLGIMVLITVAGMNVVGPQAFVAERNLERAINPALVAEGGRTGLDAAYLASLGDEAVPLVVATWSALPAADQSALAGFLEGRRVVLATEPSLQGWPAWNLTRERARAALEGWSASLR